MDSEFRRCAVIDLNNMAVNLIIANSSSVPPDGCQLIDLQEGQPFDIGWIWDGSTFIEPENSDGNA